MAASIPSTTMINPFTNDLPDKEAAMTNPKIAKAQYSGGPNFNAKLASTGARKVKARTLRIAAINEPIAAMPSAVPALPFLANI